MANNQRDWTELPLEGIPGVDVGVAFVRNGEFLLPDLSLSVGDHRKLKRSDRIGDFGLTPSFDDGHNLTLLGLTYW
jgi:hypothetical protein